MISRRGLLSAAPIVVAGVSLGGTARAANPITLVHDRRPVATIVIPAAADPQVSHAASELVRCIKASTGATLPLINTGEEPSGEGTVVYIGMIGARSRSGIAASLSELDADGYVLATGATSLTIIGPTVWGTRYGVIEFLERHLGVRWLIPGTNGEDIPERSTVTIEPSARADEPVFISRSLSPLSNGNAWNSTFAHQVWAGRNRTHSRLSFSHNLHSLMSVAVFGDPNKPETYRPEFYPIRNGQTSIPAIGRTSGWNPRFGAPGIAEAAAQRIIEHFTNNPDVVSYSLGVNDNGGFSEDDVDTTKYSALGIYSLSEPYYRFVKSVAEIVLEAFPDKKLGLLAYNSVIDPPSFPLPDNVVAMVTRDRSRWATRMAVDDQNMLKAWRAVCRNVGIYDYTYGHFYSAPRITMNATSEAYRWAAANGIRYYYSELYTIWGESPKEWILTRLLWNPRRDVQELSQDWADHAVGPDAAKHVLAYQNLWEKVWSEKVTQTSWYEAGRNRVYFYFNDASYLDAINPEHIAESRQHLQLAQSNAITPRQKARAGELLTTFQYYEASSLSYPRVPAAPTTSQEAAQLLDSSVATVDSALALAAKRQTLVTGWVSPRDPLRYLFSSLGSSTWTGWNLYSVWELGRYLKAQGASGQWLRDRLNALSTSSASANVAEFAKMTLAVGDDQLSYLGQNTSFDDGTMAPWLVEYGDPLREPVELVSTPTSTGTGHALSYPGGQRGGGISQTIPVQPGFFRFSVDVSASTGSWSGGSVLPTLVLRNATGGTIRTIHGRQVPLDRAKGTWKTVLHSDVLPDNVATVQCYCSVQFLNGHMTLYVDNAQFIQLRPH